MSVNIEVKNVRTGAKEDVQGSDGRINVSSRSDSRRYYNSRDEGESYSMVWVFNAASSTEYAAYLKNLSTDKTLVITGIGLNSEALTRFQLDTVTGTPTGDAVVPFNLNTAAPGVANVNAFEGKDGATGITGLTISSKIDQAWSQVGGHQEFRFSDALRIKQNEAIAIQVLETTGGDVGGVIFFYFE